MIRHRARAIGRYSKPAMHLPQARRSCSLAKIAGLGSRRDDWRRHVGTGSSSTPCCARHASTHRHSFHARHKRKHRSTPAPILGSSSQSGRRPCRVPPLGRTPDISRPRVGTPSSSGRAPNCRMRQEAGFADIAHARTDVVRQCDGPWLALRTRLLNPNTAQFGKRTVPARRGPRFPR